MLRKMFRGLAFGIGAATLIGLSLLPASAASGGAAGAVYALTNSPAGNAVVVYQRGADGSLTPDGLFATGGLGTGSSLGSQGGVIVSDDHQLLFAVNAGDNTISSFRIRPDGLELADTASSGGTMPTSVAFFRGLLYVLNPGVPNNVSGFVGRRGARRGAAVLCSPAVRVAPAEPDRSGRATPHRVEPGRCPAPGGPGRCGCPRERSAHPAAAAAPAGRRVGGPPAGVGVVVDDLAG